MIDYDPSVRWWLNIVEVGNNVIEFWVATSNTCTAAVRKLIQKVGTRHSTWKVETSIVPANGSVGPLSGQSQLVSLTHPCC